MAPVISLNQSTDTRFSSVSFNSLQLSFNSFIDLTVVQVFCRSLKMMRQEKGATVTDTYNTN